MSPEAEADHVVTSAAAPSPDAPSPDAPSLDAPPPFGAMVAPRSINVTAPPVEDPASFESFVVAEAMGDARPHELVVLEANTEAWAETLRRLLDETDEALRSVRRLSGLERDQVVAGFESERSSYTSALVRLVGPAALPPGAVAPVADERVVEDVAEVEAPTGTTELQLSWSPGRIVAWGGGLRAATASLDELGQLLAAAGAPASGWTEQAPVPLPDGGKAEALAAPVSDVLGWLVAVGAEGSAPVGPSARWLARVAAVAISLVARGRVVPLLRQSKSSRNGGSGPGSFSVRWTPALVDEAVLAELSSTLPGAVAALDTRSDGRVVTQGVLAGIVDAVCRTAAARVEVPAPPPSPRTNADVAETFLARLDGSRFDAPPKAGGELAGRLERWAKPVTSTLGVVHLIVSLDPPDDAGAWLLSVLAGGVDRHPVPVEVALVTAPDAARRQVDHQLVRLERLLPLLRRPGGPRRGQVVIDQDEAWELMSTIGATLEAAGYEVRLPALSRRKPTPYLRLFAEGGGQSVVGAHQLADVRWSAVFDDVELDAAEIARLAAMARPLVRSRGRWVALDHADLAEAAAALAERASTTKLSGAAMLRHALGLEGSSLAGGVRLEGTGWAVELFEKATGAPTVPNTNPDGFVGQLRTYQAEALAWLGFLDATNLGGCLALDMGLGKTPTVLAHLRLTKGDRPALVIAPPAVVGNWAAEAARFTPGLKVLVHHGAERASSRALPGVAQRADVVLTTYGTAVRDMDTLAEMDWGWVVLDEAQVIKNPSSETSQQLRRLNAQGKVALTGTPIENGLGDLWAILDFTNPGLVGTRSAFTTQLSQEGDAQGAAEAALRALNGILVFRRTKAEPAIAAELPDRIDELDRCAMTPEQIGLYQAVLDNLVTGAANASGEIGEARTGQVLAAITALKQICNHPAAYEADDRPLDGRSGKLARLEEIVEDVFASGEKVLIFTHFATWGQRLAEHLTAKFHRRVACYHGGLARGARDKLVADFQAQKGAGALVLSLKAGGTGLNLTAASHVVLYDRWWNPAVEDQARDRAWRIGQERTVVAHRLVCPGTVDERVEEVVMGKRRIADLVLPRSSSLGDLDAGQLRTALGLRSDAVLTDEELGR